MIAAYREFGREYGREPAVAVRSSATAEELPQASFAGQHESYLGAGGDAPLLTACRRSFASIFTDSLNPDAVVRGLEAVAAAEADLGAKPGAAVGEDRPGMRIDG